MFSRSGGASSCLQGFFSSADEVQVVSGFDIKDEI